MNAKMTVDDGPSGFGLNRRVRRAPSGIFFVFQRVSTSRGGMRIRLQTESFHDRRPSGGCEGTFSSCLSSMASSAEEHDTDRLHEI